MNFFVNEMCSLDKYIFKSLIFNSATKYEQLKLIPGKKMQENSFIK